MAHWIDEDTGRESCPECHGFGYHDNGTADGIECTTCRGDGVATDEAAGLYFDRGGS